MQIELTEQQRDRLVQFAATYGSNWKQVLSGMWQDGEDTDEQDGYYLRQIRNRFGPVWLDTFVL